MSEEASYNVEDIVLRIREMVETSRPMPMSSSIKLNRDELLDLLDDALEALPEELRQARWILKDRDQIMVNAQRDGDELIEAAKVHAARLVERSELVREANRVSQTIVDDANLEARRIRHEAEDYVDQRLASFEAVLERLTNTVRNGRAQLAPSGLDVLDGQTDDEGAVEEYEAIFDQDDV